MSRLSIRPRPLDFNKKLPVVKSIKDLEDDDASTSTRNSLILRIAAEVDTEQVPTKKLVADDIPTPQFVVVDTYERDYTPTFTQPTSYLRARGARAEIGEFVEYDLDNEDEGWLHEYNREGKDLVAEMFETILYKLEVLDHKTRERAGLISPTLGPPIPPLLTFDAAVESLQSLSIKYGVFQSIYNYWKSKRTRWQKPVLRRLQPPPPVNDTNPYNVFRPREKSHRLHTRRMQRRENNVQSFEKLRQVRRNLEQAKTLLQALLLREEKKRDVTENEIILQRIQLKYKNETELLEDSLALPGYTSLPGKVVSNEEEQFDSDDIANSSMQTRPLAAQNLNFQHLKHGMVYTDSTKCELRRQNALLQKTDPVEPIMLFTKPSNPEKLAAAGIVVPSDSPKPEGGFMRSPALHGRIGRGGRIVFDRCDVLMKNLVEGDETSCLPRYP